MTEYYVQNIIIGLTYFFRFQNRYTWVNKLLQTSFYTYTYFNFTEEKKLKWAYKY